jgi:uncharacterized damage-inducible protein DinB
MSNSANELARSVTSEAFAELSSAWQKVQHCLAQLHDEQLWDRPAEGLNSIANLLLHLRGNLTQWIISGLGGAPDIRNRPLEFAEREPIPRTELIAGLESAIESARRVLESLDANELLRRRRIQGFEVSGIQALFETVAHFRGHSQEIVHMTRRLLGDRYQFNFVPQTPEQGAP